MNIAEKPRGCYTENKALEFLIKRMKEIGKAKTTGFESRSSGQQDWADDMNFYIDQKGPRLQHMEGVDGILPLKERRKQSKIMKQSSSSKSSDTVETPADQIDQVS